MKKAACIAADLLWAASASAEQKHGVEVYPGARPDANVAKQLEKMNIKNGATYRTTDSAAKVADFYRKQGGLKEFGTGNAQGATFQGNKVMVTIQNPWMDMSNGAKMSDTLISIVPGK